MKKYTVEIVFEEGNDEFWEEITEGDKTGCDGLVEAVKEELQNYFPVSVKITKFEDK